MIAYFTIPNVFWGEMRRPLWLRVPELMRFTFLEDPPEFVLVPFCDLRQSFLLFLGQLNEENKEKGRGKEWIKKGYELHV